MNSDRFLLIVIAISAPALIVLGALAMGVLDWLIGGIVLLSIVGVALTWVLSSPVVKIRAAGLQHQSESNRHAEAMAKHIEAMARIGYLPDDDGGYKPIRLLQIAAPEQHNEPAPDPRHRLLVELCLATIRADKYGPTSKRLMTADDAQARGGQFADRNNWDAASKYGQSIGYLYVQVGGKADEQGLKIKLDNGGCTTTDLISALLRRNIARDAAVNALPGVER